MERENKAKPPRGGVVKRDDSEAKKNIPVRKEPIALNVSTARAAIVLSEIIGPPVSRRRRRFK